MMLWQDSNPEKHLSLEWLHKDPFPDSCIGFSTSDKIQWPFRLGEYKSFECFSNTFAVVVSPFPLQLASAADSETQITVRTISLPCPGHRWKIREKVQIFVAIWMAGAWLCWKSGFVPQSRELTNYSAQMYAL
jgi:hypothetical protein